MQRIGRGWGKTKANWAVFKLLAKPHLPILSGFAFKALLAPASH